MHKRSSLINKPIFSIEYFWIPGIYNVLNYVRIFIHFGLILIFTTLSSGFFSKLIFILPPFLSIFTHHILFPDLIKSFTHFAELLIFKSKELFQLHKLDVLKRTLRRFLLRSINLLGQNRICRYGVYLLLYNCSFQILIWPRN